MGERLGARLVQDAAHGLSRATAGRSFWPGCWSDTPTALCAGEVRGHFSITHPFHPLLGQRFELIQRLRNWHEERVRFRDERGERAGSLPLSWTSLAPPDPFRERSAGRAWFRVEDLLALSELVRALRRAREKEKGGRDGV